MDCKWFRVLASIEKSEETISSRYSSTTAQSCTPSSSMRKVALVSSLLSTERMRTTFAYYLLLRSVYYKVAQTLLVDASP